MHVPRPNTIILSSGFAVALAVAACGGADNTRGNNASGATGGATGTSSERNAPVTLTGCLQKGSGSREYILTQASRSAGAVGTTGSASESAAREQQQAAARSYRLGGNTDRLDDLVGKQVRVTGRITDEGNAAKSESGREPSAGSAADTNANRRDIDASDLAKVDVDSAEKVSDDCSNPQSGSTKQNQ